MAIIYSYPLNLNILDTDIIIGTTTRLVNGRPKNQTKSFKIEDLANYFIPTLNQVLQVGNVSQLDAKIGELYLYDDSVGGYAKMGVSDNVFMLDSADGVTMLTIDNGNNLVLNNGIAAAQIINPLTTNRTYTLPDKSGTIALTTDVPTLQQVVDIGNSVNLAVDDTEAIIVNMVAAPTVNQKGIKVNMPTQTGVPFARGDCFVATINGQNPGTLPNYVSGFYTIAQSGADNYSFSSQHDSAVIAPSRHFSANNSPSATSDFASFNANDVEVFNIDYLGNATANTLSVYDGPNGEYCKIAINDGYFTISKPDGAFTPMLSTENGDNLILTNSNGAAAKILNNLLVSRSYTLPNASGTFALTSDITVPTLQQVTEAGATSNIGIQVSTADESSIFAYSGTGLGVYGYSDEGVGVYGYSEIGRAISAYGVSGIGLEIYGNGSGTPSIDMNLGNSNKGLVIDSGTSSTGNPIEVNKNGALKFRVNQAGDVVANLLTLTSNLTIPATGSELILSVSSGGTVSGLATTTYASPFELTYLKGVTSAIQNQIDLKATKLMSAYSIRVNNTAVVADAQEVSYFSSGMIPMTETISFVATIAPTNPNIHTYNWSRIGNMVDIVVNLDYSTSGTGVSVVSFPFPSTLPNPIIPTGFTVANAVLYTGAARATSTFQAGSANASNLSSFVRINSLSNGYEFGILATPGTYQKFSISIKYFTA